METPHIKPSPLPHGGPRMKSFFIDSKPDPLKDYHGTRECPRCGQPVPERSWGTSKSFSFREIDPSIPLRNARVSSRGFVRKLPLLNKIFATDMLPVHADGTINRSLISADSRHWRICSPGACCATCGTAPFKKFEYARQYSLFRDALVALVTDFPCLKRIVFYH